MTRGPIFLILFGVFAIAEAQEKCPDIPFEEAGVSRERVALEQVEGEVIAAPEGHPDRLGHVGNVCLALFREPSKARVATAVTPQEGGFRFENPDVGDYVLIGRPLHGSAASVRVPLHVLAPSAGMPERGLVLRVSVQGAGPAEAGIIADVQLRRQLLDRVKIDQGVRMELIRNDITKRSPELSERMKSIDAETDVWLKGIVRTHGWPGRDVAGVDGASAAATMLMHVPPETQNQMLPLVEAAFKRGTVRGETYAMLFDHVRVGAGQPQRYGTVARPITADRQVVFFPIEDEANVDARRAEMGMLPLAEYREGMKRLYLPEKK